MRENTIPDDTKHIIRTTSRFLKEYRLQSGLTMRQLHDLSGIHYNTIHKIEHGHSYNILSLIEIALALDLPLRELFWEL